MPIHENNVLDDPIVFDGDMAFTGWQPNRAPRLLGEGQLALLENGEIDDLGRVIARNGVQQVGAMAPAAWRASIRGLHYFDRQGAEHLVCIRANSGISTTATAYLLDELDVNSWTIHPWQAAGAIELAHPGAIGMAQLVDQLYLTTGAKGYRLNNETRHFEELEEWPAWKQILTHRYRLAGYGSDEYPDAIEFSDILSDEDGLQWGGPTATLRIGEGDGDPIVGCLSWRQNLILVAKEASLWVIDADPQNDPAAWTIDRVPGPDGCIAPRTLCSVGNDIWFLSRRGLMSVRRMQGQQDQEVSLPLSQPIKEWFKDINWNHAHKSCAAYYENRYLLSVPYGRHATEPNVTLVYDTVRQAWIGAFRGFSPICWSHTKFGGDRQLVCASDRGEVLWWRVDDPVWYRDQQQRPSTMATPSTAQVGDRVRGMWPPLGNTDPAIAATTWEVRSLGKYTSAGSFDPDVWLGNMQGYSGWPVGPAGMVGKFYGFDLLLVESDTLQCVMETRAYTFGDPRTPKIGSYIELEWRDSLATVELYVALDGGAWQAITLHSWTGRTSAAAAPAPLAANSAAADTGALRKSGSLQNLGEFHEIQLRIVSKGDAFCLREIFLAAWLQTGRIEK